MYFIRLKKLVIYLTAQTSAEPKKVTPTHRGMSYDYKTRKIGKKIEQGKDHFFKMFSDREITLLLLWAVIGPLCALAYLVWIKYPKLRVLSVLFFILNIIYLVGQIGGWLYILPRANIIGILHSLF